MLPLGVVAGRWPWKDGTPAVTRLLGCDTGPSTFTTWGEPGQIHYGLLPSSPWCPGKGISGHEAPPPAPPLGHPLWMGWGAGGGRDALSPAASTGCVCFLQISCSSAEAPSSPTALPRLCCGGPATQGQGGSAPLVPEGLPTPQATQDGTGRGRGRGTCSSGPGLSSFAMDLSKRKCIPSTICWPGAELPREG